MWRKNRLRTGPQEPLTRKDNPGHRKRPHRPAGVARPRPREDDILAKTGVKVLDEIAKMTGGKIEEVGVLSDESGFAVMSMPLPVDHWLYAEGFNDPPAPLRMGIDNPLRQPLAEALRAAGRYAVRCATRNGKENDFDPDALVRSIVIGMLGYFTPDGFSSLDD